MRALPIHFPRNLRQSFTRAAKKAFPAETFAYCLGTKDQSGALSISHLHYPTIILTNDGFGFEVPPAAWPIASRLASSLGTKILSTCHSHPYLENEGLDDAAPSETDWDYLFADLPMGICSIVQFKGKLSSRYRFWPRIKPITLTS